MKAKKIGILVPSLSDGGAEKVAANLSILYKELGYEVYLILYEKRISFDYEGEIINLDIKKRTGISKLFKDLEIYFKLKKIKKNYNFDLVISHLPKCDLFNCLTKRNEKVITTVHNNIEIDYPSYMKKMIPYIIKKSDLIASVSKIGESYLKENYNCKNVKTIYNLQMLDRIKLLAKEKINEIDESIFKDKTIINVGRLDNQKGQWHLIRAFREALKIKSDLNLIIIGRGSFEERLKLLVKNLNIEDKVFFLGFNKNPYKFMEKSSLYLSTSLHEGLPMTYIEAMSLNNPIISTDCISGPREIIAPNNLSGNIKYGEELDYGVLVSNFGNSNGIDNLNSSEEEIKLGKLIVDILENQNMYKSLEIKALKRSEDFDYKNIKELWEKELLMLLGE
ncbi:MAG: glycosyltransferase [Sarcina sp.]